nr:hypothetical protein [uncultured Fluviicola sp.]
MKMTVYFLAIGGTFLWTGFVCAISFMEAWLKFRAPGITRPLGLGIGRLVFNALNKVEWFFALILVSCYFLFEQKLALTGSICYFTPLLLLILQTIWLLPALDGRAELHIKGDTVPRSNLHFYYVAFELAKVTFLIWSGTILFNQLGSGMLN